MTTDKGTTRHASCVLVGRSAVLIRGPSGSGKSRLALALIRAGESGLLPPARLVADDRVHLFAAHGRLLAAAPDAIRGKIEVRGFGIAEFPCEPLALVELVVDLAAEDASRLPDAAARSAEILGVKLSRLPVAKGAEPFSPVLAALKTVTKA
ncbi:MAG: HPr kinase/phosphatase C-terminal domain-containing protein [Bradyrhizobiaceae bacterium]|nr:HPr kinase/phosphatase C-terminal domain-containing protein [Bradyrhizobiaceae bacterium]